MLNGRAVKATRAVQVALLLLAALAGLSMAEQAPATRAVGQESLSLGVEAPVEHPRGPWSADHVFTEASAGVPVDVAPHWNLTPRHGTSGIEADGHAWTATLVLREQGSAGGSWWTIREEMPIEGDGSTVRVPFDAGSTLERAKQLEAEADVPGDLQIRIVVRHHGDLVVGGQDRSTVTVASLLAVPDGDRLTLSTEEDGTTFSETVEAGLSPLPFALAGAAIALEVVPWRARRDRRPWDDPAIETVEVRGLAVPSDMPRTELDRLLAVARRRDGVVLVDPSAGIAVLEGPTDLWARIEPEPFQTVPDDPPDGPDDPSWVDDLISR